jgi:predicted RNase H-like HicB family nuclease
MEFEGKVWKSKTSKYWLVEVPSLDVMTQGTSYKNALLMIKDAIEMLLSGYFPQEESVSIDVVDYKGGNIGVSAQDSKLLLALSLRRQRTKSGATVREVAGRLGSKSPNSYAPYERGEKKPSLDKFEQLIHAVNPSNPLRLRIA